MSLSFGRAEFSLHDPALKLTYEHPDEFDRVVGTSRFREGPPPPKEPDQEGD